MKEQEFIKIIKAISGNEYIGDDCAYLKDLGIVITQDSLLEWVHFKREWYTPYQLGYKSAAVNISDILASGAIPKYLTIALSLPDETDEHFVKEFYKGVSSCLFGAKIVGGDITGSKNGIFISITAIGIDEGRKISSRSGAKVGYKVVVKGEHGTSAAGLAELLSGGNNKELIEAHLKPKLEVDFSRFIAENINDDYAMMDTSDGLADALFKIADESKVKIKADYNKIKHLPNITKNQVLFGGEDYKLVAVVPEKIAKDSGGTIIGEVEEYDGIKLDISGELYRKYDDLKTYNHFGV